MAVTPSKEIELGFPAPDFHLISVDGKKYNLASFKDAKLLLVMFICNHCPYVLAVEDRIIQLQRDYQAKGVQLVGICSNDATEYPDDAPAQLLKKWREKEFRFPYLIDESQEIAKQYTAACTPDIYLFDQQRKLAYHGRIDDNWKDTKQVTRHDLREAIEALLSDQKPSSNQQQSIGCSIKWKSKE